MLDLLFKALYSITKEISHGHLRDLVIEYHPLLLFYLESSLIYLFYFNETSLAFYSVNIIIQIFYQTRSSMNQTFILISIPTWHFDEYSSNLAQWIQPFSKFKFQKCHVLFVNSWYVVILYFWYNIFILCLCQLTSDMNTPIINFWWSEHYNLWTSTVDIIF